MLQAKRTASWVVLLAGPLSVGCDALLNIPSQENYEGPGTDASQPDATLPADAGGDGASSDANDRQDASDAGAGDAGAGDAGAGDADSATGPDCSTIFNPDWADWPMPNSAQDVEAGSPTPESYTDNRNGTVTDNVTGLMWQQVPATAQLSWSDARNYCVTLMLAGHTDWRLASYIELISLVDYGPSFPAVNTTYFPGTPRDIFWSSSPFNAKATIITPSAFFVNFDDGSTSYDILTDLHWVRCVRKANSP
jgi:hypothetical protein